MNNEKNDGEITIPADKLTEVQEYWLPVKQSRDKMKFHAQELSYFRAEHEAALLRFWRQMKKQFLCVLCAFAVNTASGV